jgi:hypothetical protein
MDMRGCRSSGQTAETDPDAHFVRRGIVCDDRRTRSRGRDNRDFVRSTKHYFVNLGVRSRNAGKEHDPRQKEPEFPHLSPLVVIVIGDSLFRTV